MRPPPPDAIPRKEARHGCQAERAPVAVPEPVRAQVRFDLKALGQRPQPLSESGRAESATFRVQEQRYGMRALFATRLTIPPEVLLQLVVRHEDDPFPAALSIHDDLTRVGKDVAGLQICQFADPEPRHDEQLEDQDRDISHRGWAGFICFRFRGLQDLHVVCTEDHLQCLPIHRTGRQSGIRTEIRRSANEEGRAAFRPSRLAK